MTVQRKVRLVGQVSSSHSPAKYCLITVFFESFEVCEVLGCDRIDDHPIDGIVILDCKVAETDGFLGQRDVQKAVFSQHIESLVHRFWGRLLQFAENMNCDVHTDLYGSAQVKSEHVL